MARVSIATIDRAEPEPAPQGFAGSGETRACFAGAKHPIHLHSHRLASGEVLRIGPLEADCAAYVWVGEVRAADVALTAGSSLIVERGATLEVAGDDGGATLLTFAASRPAAKPRRGGHVHLLPSERVPRFSDPGGAGSVGGELHADAACPTCAVWLHGNAFQGAAEAGPADAERGVHSHSEDEVIFVTEGAMRLGHRLYGPGTAVAIAAETMYSFTPGPDGLRFINFRAGAPSAIRFKNGQVMDEVGYWRTRVEPPRYITLDASGQG